MEARHIAGQRIAKFLQKAYGALIAQRQERNRLLEMHAHAWQTLVIRFRYNCTRMHKQGYPIRMEYDEDYSSYFNEKEYDGYDSYEEGLAAFRDQMCSM